MWLIVFALFVLALVLLLSSLYALLSTRVPVVRTPVQFLDEIGKALAPEPGQVVFDAGCADARTLLALCASPGVRGRGCELNGAVWLVGLVRCWLSANRGRVRVCWKDFFRCELEDVDLVYCHLMPGVMGRVAAKCLEEMRPRSRLASFLWEVPGLSPSRVLKLGVREDPLYIYEIPSAAAPAGPEPGISNRIDLRSKT